MGTGTLERPKTCDRQACGTAAAKPRAAVGRFGRPVRNRCLRADPGPCRRAVACPHGIGALRGHALDRPALVWRRCRLGLEPPAERRLGHAAQPLRRCTLAPRRGAPGRDGKPFLFRGAIEGPPSIWRGSGSGWGRLSSCCDKSSPRRRKNRESRQSGAAGRQLAMLVVTLGVLLAGLGIWQHYVYYPRAYEEYRGIQSELDKLRENPRENARRIGELELKLEAQGVPSETAGRQQFENRLRFSNEPFGPFAAGQHVCRFFAGGGHSGWRAFRTARRTLTKTGWIAWGAVFLLLVYCLVLTKSRTAWIALAVACAFQGAGNRAGRIAVEPAGHPVGRGGDSGGGRHTRHPLDGGRIGGRI